MSNLAQRLTDAARSGVYWTPRCVEIEDAVSGTGLDLAHADLHGADGNAVLLERLAAALGIPLRDVSDWNLLEVDSGGPGRCTGAGRVILFTGHEEVAADGLDALVNALGEGAARWRDHGRSFFAVFVDATNALMLPPLFRPKSD